MLKGKRMGEGLIQGLFSDFVLKGNTVRGLLGSS